MSVSTVARKCPSCQSENLEYGMIYVGMNRNIFIAKGTSFISGPFYNSSAYVCVDCGALGCYLDEKELTTLRKNLASKNKTK